MRLVLAQRASIEMYPPVLHQAALLQCIGDVKIVDAPGRGVNVATQTPPEVARVRMLAGGPGEKSTSLSRMQSALQYARVYRRELADAPDVAIAYEPDAAALLLHYRKQRSNTMRIVHLHEIPDKTLYSSSVASSLAIRYTLANLKHADLVLVPDSDRASYATRIAKLARPPMVVMNCPRKLERLPESKLLPWLEARGVHSARIVHFQGSIGPDHGLAQVIASMRFWPSDSIFVVVGDGPAEYLEALRALAGREGVEMRLLFAGRVPYSEVFAYAVGAAVGVTLLEPINANWTFAAGASNKRFEYAAMGIPQVANIGAGMDAVFGSLRIAELVNASDVKAIGSAIANLLCNQPYAMAAGERARRVHLGTYNYEHQFAPVLDHIRHWKPVECEPARS